MANKKWYAVLMDSDDTDWGTGSTDWDEAVSIARGLGEDSQIAEIDEGNDPICVAVYRNGIDF